MMEIAFFECREDEEKYFRDGLKNHDTRYYAGILSEKNANLAVDADVISIFIFSRIDERLLNLMPKLKIIVTRSTGYDHIDLDACRKKGILVSYIPMYSTISVAEHAFSLILALSRDLKNSMKQAENCKVEIERLKCREISGKTLGVIGTGRIGLSVIKMAKGFGMKVIAYDVNENREAQSELGFEYAGLKQVFRESDIISIHCLLNEETRHMIDERAISEMKKGVLIINTARGAIIETKALIRGLKSGKIFGAGIDVFEDEKELNKKIPVNVQELIKNNVIVTPHIAYYSQESFERMKRITFDNIISYIGKKPINLVQNV